MSTKKIVLIVVGIVAVLALLGALFVVGIGWFVFSTIGNSEAAETARAYLRSNEVLKKEVGDVKDFGWLVTGNITIRNTSGEATLSFKVIGDRKTVNATVDLVRSNESWRVTEAWYETEAGNKVFLTAAPDTSLPPAVPNSQT